MQPESAVMQTKVA